MKRMQLSVIAGLMLRLAVSSSMGSAIYWTDYADGAVRPEGESRRREE